MSQTNLDGIPIKSKDSMAEEMSEREFTMYIIKMIREANKEMKEQMQALKDEMKGQMQALNECTNLQLKELIQEAKDHFNKELKILKKNKQKSLK